MRFIDKYILISYNITNLHLGGNFLEKFIDILRDFNYVTIALRIVLATFAGGIIGNERGKHGSPAGLRTHILVCIGSAVTALTGFYINATLGINTDITRLAAQVVSGIGFLGAGMIIIKNSNIIIGLTTAAGLWATAAIGIALGFGFYSGAIIATFFCVFTAAFLSRLERKKKKATRLYLEIDLTYNTQETINKIKEVLGEDANIESVQPKSNVQNSLGLYFSASSIIPTEKLQEVNEIESIRFYLYE